MKLATFLKGKTPDDRAALAERIGVTREALRKYEAGERIPRPAIAAKIKLATGGAVTPDDLFASYQDARKAAVP